jgi:hypothetical protein
VAIERAVGDCGFDAACLKPLKRCFAGVETRFDAILACWWRT